MQVISIFEGFEGCLKLSDFVCFISSSAESLEISEIKWSKKETIHNIVQHFGAFPPIIGLVPASVLLYLCKYLIPKTLLNFFALLNLNWTYTYIGIGMISVGEEVLECSVIFLD